MWCLRAVTAAEGGRSFLTRGKTRKRSAQVLYQHITMHLFVEKTRAREDDRLPWRGHVRDTCA